MTVSATRSVTGADPWCFFPEEAPIETANILIRFLGEASPKH